MSTTTSTSLRPSPCSPAMCWPTTRIAATRTTIFTAIQIAPDAALDFAKWVVPRPTEYPPTQMLAQAVADLNGRYFPLRRQWIYTTLVNQGYYIAPQPTNAVVTIGAIEFNPASRNQAHEYIQLINTNSYPVDISGWRLTGAIDYTFRVGVVLP